MTVTIQQLFPPTVLASSVGVIYTAPTTPTTTVVGQGRIRFTNTDTATRSITAYAVPSAGSPGVSNTFMKAETLAANMHLDIDLPVLAPGDTFQAFADAPAVVVVFELDGVIFS
jgi:hypothetical protein